MFFLRSEQALKPTCCQREPCIDLESSTMNTVWYICSISNAFSSSVTCSGDGDRDARTSLSSLNGSVGGEAGGNDKEGPGTFTTSPSNESEENQYMFDWTICQDKTHRSQGLATDEVVVLAGCFEPWTDSTAKDFETSLPSLA